jgi:hypothetical protein
MTARSDFILTLNNVVSKNVANNYQAITIGGASFAGATGIALSASPNTTLSGVFALSFGFLLVSGDIELDSEPTTYTTAANMEGVLPVSVYIPPVSSGVAGIFPALNTEFDNATATRMGLKKYLHGTTYNGGIAPTVAGYLVTLNDISGVFMPYQNHDLSWGLRGWIRADTAASIKADFTLNGITSSSISRSINISGGSTNNAAFSGRNSENTNLFYCRTYSGAVTELNWYVYFDIDLASKPTWAY